MERKRKKGREKTGKEMRREKRERKRVRSLIIITLHRRVITVTTQSHHTRSPHKVITKGHHTGSTHKVISYHTGSSHKVITQGHHKRSPHKITTNVQHTRSSVITQGHHTVTMHNYHYSVTICIVTISFKVIHHTIITIKVILLYITKSLYIYHTLLVRIHDSECM